MTTNTHGLRIKDVPFSFSYDAGLAAPAPSRREPMTAANIQDAINKIEAL